MRVVGIDPTTNSLTIVLVEGDAKSFVVPYRDEWHLAAEHRCDDYVSIRERLVTQLTKWKPDAVCINDLEPASLNPHARRRGGPNMQWFRTAELRGVLAEASRSVCVGTEIRARATTRSTVGGRSLDDYVDDDVFWQHLGKDFFKKFRPAALLALSKIRER